MTSSHPGAANAVGTEQALTVTRHSARAAVARSPHAPFAIEDISLEDPRDDEVLVRLVATGVCHTDLIARDQLYPVPQPIVLGHEGAGVIEKVGAGIRHVEPGDHVVLTFLACGRCATCRDGAPAYCLNLFQLCFGGSRADGSSAICDARGGPLHGHFFGQSSFSTLAVANGRNVVKVRRDAPLALLGPLGCGIQTGAGAILNTLRPAAGQSLAIFGAGAVGLSAVIAARLIEASPIIVIDVNPARLSLARELGADVVINAAETDVLADIQAASGGGADFTLEASGLPLVLRQAIDALGQRGTCGIVGAPAFGSEGSFDITDLIVGGKTIRGIVEGDSVPEKFIPQMVDLYLDGRFPIDRLVTTYPFDAINQAVADAERGVVVKPVILLS
jgi:aryl-alcohol dehydrogenase